MQEQSAEMTAVIGLAPDQRRLISAGSGFCKTAEDPQGQGQEHSRIPLSSADIVSAQQQAVLILLGSAAGEYLHRKRGAP